VAASKQFSFTKGTVLGLNRVLFLGFYEVSAITKSLLRRVSFRPRDFISRIRNVLRFTINGVALALGAL